MHRAVRRRARQKPRLPLTGEGRGEGKLPRLAIPTPSVVYAVVGSPPAPPRPSLARRAEIVPDQRIGADAEELLAVEHPVAVGIGDQRVGAVEVQLVAIGHPVGIGVGVVGIEAQLPLHGVGVVVGIQIGLGGDRGSGRRDRGRLAGAVSATDSATGSATGAGAASGASTAFGPAVAMPVVRVPGAMETLDDPGGQFQVRGLWPDLGAAPRPAA